MDWYLAFVCFRESYFSNSIAVIPFKITIVTAISFLVIIALQLVPFISSSL